MNHYILMAALDENILGIYETALKYFYGGEVVCVLQPQDAVKFLKEKGRPEFIFLDFNFLVAENKILYNHLEEAQMHVPLLAYSNSPEDQARLRDFPLTTALLEKPVGVESFKYIVKGLITSAPISPAFIPVKIKWAMDLAGGAFDFFIKLSGTNFVKIVNKGDFLTTAEGERLLAKGISEIYIRASDSHEFLSICEINLDLLSTSQMLKPVEGISMAMEALEQVEGISKAFGWTNEVVAQAKKTIALAIELLSKDAKLADALNKRISNPSSPYSLHISLLSFLSCSFCSFLGWAGESGQMKLIMAALIHDLSLDELYYQNIREWDARAANPRDKAVDTIKYRLHPLEAAKIAQSLDALPPDVDQIILQHHEKLDGSGFPRGLTASRIGHLPTLFIMVEDLIEFIGDGKDLETSLKDYLTWGASFYDTGNFKKIFDLIKEKIHKEF